MGAAGAGALTTTWHKAYTKRNNQSCISDGPMLTQVALLSPQDEHTITEHTITVPIFCVRKDQTTIHSLYWVSYLSVSPGLAHFIFGSVVYRRGCLKTEP